MVGACGPTPTADGPNRELEHKTPAAPATPKPSPKDIEPAQPTPIDPIPEGEPVPTRWGQDPYDPEGAEEEGCPNGDWCGPPEVARKLAPEHDPEEIGCPTHIRGSVKHDLEPDDKRLVGLSNDPMMMGRLRKLASADARKNGPDDICCYHWFDYCSGRPLLVPTNDISTLAALTAHTAATIPGCAWSDGRPSTEHPSPEIGRQWLEDARLEHASIAAFAQQNLDLLRMGAPPELLRETVVAGRDEVAHACACFRLASVHLGQALQPGPLAARGRSRHDTPRTDVGEATREQSLGPRPHLNIGKIDLKKFACALFLEGCVGETIASLTAMRAAREAVCPHTRALLQTIADDEARHAALAWQTLAFTFDRGGTSVVHSVRALADAFERELATVNTPRETGDLAGAEAYGRLGVHARTDARNAAWRELIVPFLDELVSANHPGQRPEASRART